VVHVLSLSSVIFGMWLLLSGHWTPLFFFLGLLSTAVAVFFALRMEVVDDEGVPVLHLNWHILTYLPWLIWEVLKANVTVARIVLDPKLPISPGIARIRGKSQTDLGRVIFANSITMTPGTVTVGVSGTELQVHALVGDDLEGMEEGAMNRKVAMLERVGP
jgi:multicomponent Na+:H+ antiporter subunit E